MQIVKSVNFRNVNNINLIPAAVWLNLHIADNLFSYIIDTDTSGFFMMHPDNIRLIARFTLDTGMTRTAGFLSVPFTLQCFGKNARRHLFSRTHRSVKNIGM